MHTFAGNFDVPYDPVMANSCGHQLEWHRASGKNEDNDFVQGAIFQLNAFVRNVYAKAVALSLGIGVFNCNSRGPTD